MTRVVPIMQKQKYGRIVYISSTAAGVGSLVAHVAYGVTKAGLLALMKRRGKPDEVAEIIACIVSERAGYLTGQNICVDGGFNLR